MRKKELKRKDSTASKKARNQVIAASLDVKKKTTRFIGLYVLNIGLLILLYLTFIDELTFVSTFTAGVLSSILNILGVENLLNEAVVQLGGISMQVIDECTGIYEVFVYTAGVMAYPATVKDKAAGIVFGVPALLSMNMIRLVSLAFVGVWYPPRFEYIHCYLWQVTLIILVLLIMIVWIEKVVKKEV